MSEVAGMYNSVAEENLEKLREEVSPQDVSLRSMKVETGDRK